MRVAMSIMLSMASGDMFFIIDAACCAISGVILGMPGMAAEEAAVICAICSSDRLAIMSLMFFIMSGFERICSRMLLSAAEFMEGMDVLEAAAAAPGVHNCSGSSAGSGAGVPCSTSTPAAAAASRASLSALPTMVSSGDSEEARAKTDTASRSLPSAWRARPLCGGQLMVQARVCQWLQRTDGSSP